MGSLIPFLPTHNLSHILMLSKSLSFSFTLAKSKHI